MDILLCGIYDETLEVVVVQLRGAKLCSTGFAGPAPDFKKGPEWETKPYF